MDKGNDVVEPNPYIGADTGVDPEDAALEAAEAELSGAAEPEPEPEQAPEKQTETEKQPEPEKGAEAAPAEDEPEEKPQAVKEEVKPQTIPKARLDKQIRKTRELERQLAELQAKQQPPLAPAPEPEAADGTDQSSAEELAQAALDGNTARFAEIYAANMKKVAEQAARNAAEAIQKDVPKAVSANQAEQEFNQAVVELESQYAFLNPDDDSYEPELEETISNFTNSYVRSGSTPAEAVKLAAEKVLKIEKPELFVAAPETSKADKVRQERLNIDKKLKAAQQQPAAIEKGEIDEPPIPDFSTMTDEEFDKLSDAEQDAYLERMRKARS